MALIFPSNAKFTASFIYWYDALPQIDELNPYLTLLILLPTFKQLIAVLPLFLISLKEEQIFISMF